MAYKKSAFKKRPGVSNIIGSLIVLAIVASVGSVILFQGLNQINSFDADLTTHDRAHNEALREKIIFEHVQFDPDTTDLTLYLANVGSIDSTIQAVTIVKNDSQELILRNNTLNTVILIEDHVEILLNPDLPTGPDQFWNSTEYRDSDYKIWVTTSKGNAFPEVTTPPEMLQS
jgi:hypothetical protein